MTQLTLVNKQDQAIARVENQMFFRDFATAHSVNIYGYMIYSYQVSDQIQSLITFTNTQYVVSFYETATDKRVGTIHANKNENLPIRIHQGA